MSSSTSRIGMGREPLSPCAVDHRQSRGRLYAEPESATRTAYQRDRDRIVHSTAFRRLKHKTQVFVATEADHYRTRLTHTIEVSQIARAFARALRLDEDLTEAVALVHDFGHPPFGHAGERALDRAMQPFGGFDHNAQALKIVTVLEQRYAEFDGLNLAWETLEGLVKHNGPLTGPHALVAELPPAIESFDALMPLDLARFPGLEAQCAAISDDIAYNTHDLDDGLRAGLIAIDDLRELELAGSILAEIEARYPALAPGRLANEIMRRHITRMVEDVIATSLSNLDTLDPGHADDVRDASFAMIAFSDAMRSAVDETRRFLFQRVYRAPSVTRVMDEAEAIVERLFHRFMAEPERLPAEWSHEFGRMKPHKQARRIADYLSGMTDTFALGEHRRLFDQPTRLG
ncbi:deoxyguanosinetriphosphate triphosphohydrolase [Fulvimarina sp. 2208YS6-2-32]|uniref:Deoxyguanosinetriphosphate triphosphohydrolase-like protein n=1 Tax=Fulvimarina uroteuthidis TaxID=3098149 RepID=A0ABU5I5D5_9HYPH|nr:deoxyguanosinetriphosphate triphosphohydrolase [Fulvimarina sp. 2208YS6-2-32]MDY8110608.1 deoxyguanosinetriphosphate triphosphohydrolase [Fulvimarina sp. 2208YS6-2-32]